MSCSLHRFLGRKKGRLAESSSSYPGSETVDVSEIWVDSSTTKTTITTRSTKSQLNNSRRCVHRTISKSGVAAWLETSSRSKSILTPESLFITSTCAARFVWAEYDVRQNTYDVDAEALAQILTAFQLDEVQQHSSSGYSWSSEEECLRSETGPSLPWMSTPVPSYYFGKHPRISLTWSRSGDGASVMTSAVCIAQSSKTKILRDLLDCEFVQQLVRHKMLLPLLSALLLTRETDETQEMIENQVREVEVRTGYHIWRSRREDAALGDLNSLSAKMSGCESKIAESLRKLEVTMELTRFIHGQLEKLSQNSANDDAGSWELRSYLDVVGQRTKMQRIDAEFYAQRAKCQLTALFHLIAQNDNVVGQEIARDSRLLALAAQRDSSSVKSLAIVTMVFLPGTFVSSLFSMPLFDFDASDTRHMYRQSFWGPRLLAYAAVTLPLMILTFATCGLWLYYQSSQSRKQRSEAQSQLDLVQKENELDALTKRRMSTVPSVDGAKNSEGSQTGRE